MALGPHVVRQTKTSDWNNVQQTLRVQHPSAYQQPAQAAPAPQQGPALPAYPPPVGPGPGTGPAAAPPPAAPAAAPSPAPAAGGTPMATPEAPAMTGGGGGGAAAMSALSRLSQGPGASYGTERQTPIDAALGMRSIPAAGRALAALARAQGRVY